MCKKIEIFGVSKFYWISCLEKGKIGKGERKMEYMEKCAVAFIAAAEILNDFGVQERLLNSMRDYEEDMEAGNCKEAYHLAIKLFEDSMCKYICLGSQQTLRNQALELVQRGSIDAFL